MFSKLNALADFFVPLLYKGEIEAGGIMDPTEEQFLVFNALDTLQMLRRDFFEAQSGVWYLETLSPVLSLSRLMPDGEILPLEIGYE